MQKFPTKTIHKLKTNQLQIISSSQLLLRNRTNNNTPINIIHNSCTDLRNKYSRIRRHQCIFTCTQITMDKFD